MIDGSKNINCWLWFDCQGLHVIENCNNRDKLWPDGPLDSNQTLLPYLAMAGSKDATGA